MDNRKLNEVMSTICSKDVDSFRRVIINMTFSPEKFFEFNGFSKPEIEELLPKWKSIRKEMRNKFSWTRPMFSMGTTPETSFPPELRSAARGDIYLMEYIYERIANYMGTYGGKERALFLLSQEEENYRFGGLRELGFSYNQAQVLLNMPGMPEAIAVVLKAVLDEQSAQYAEAEAQPEAYQEAEITQPEAYQETEAQYDGNQEVEESQPEDKICSTAFTLQELIMKFPEDVTAFVDAAEKLLGEGFDETNLEDLLFKREGVINLIDAVKNLQTV